MKNKKHSLHSISQEIENETFNESVDGNINISYRTLERRFEDLMEKLNINIEELKENKHENYFKESEAIFIKGILKQTIDKNSFAYKLLKDKNDEINLNEVRPFMENIDEYMSEKINDDERKSFMSYLDQSLNYSAIIEMHNIYNILSCLNENLKTTIYEYRLRSLIKLRQHLEGIFIENTVESVMYFEDLFEVLKDVKEFTDNIDDNYDVDDMAIKEEYKARDKNIKDFLEANLLVKEHIENKINIKIDEIFE